MKKIMLLAFLLCSIKFSADAQLQSRWRWSNVYGNKVSWEYGGKTKTDINGNVYTLILYKDSITAGGTTLPGANNGFLFWNYALLKHDAAGNLLYVKGIYGNSITTNISCNGLAVDDKGNVYLAGDLIGPVTIGNMSTGSNPTNGTQSFIAKLDDKGNNVWLKTFGGQNHDWLYDIAVNKSGDIVVTGAFQGTTNTYGNITINNAGGYTNFLLAELDPAGNFKWVTYTKYGQVKSGFAYLETDGSNNIYVAGSISNSISFDGISYQIVGNNTMYYAKFDSVGNYIRSDVPKFGNPDVRGMTIDQHGNVSISGYYSDSTSFNGSDTLRATEKFPYYIVQYDSTGTANWVRGISAGNLHHGWLSMTTDLNNNVIVGARTNYVLTYGTDTLTKVSEPTDMVITYSPLGKILRIDEIKTAGSITDVATDLSNNVYVVGHYNSQYLKIGNTTYKDSSSSSTQLDAYIAKLERNQMITIMGLDKQSYCVGDSISIAYGIIDTIIAPNSILYFEISDSGGYFSSPVLLGTDTIKSMTGTATFLLPASLPTGTEYRVRVSSTTPRYYTPPTATFSLNALPPKPTITYSPTQLSTNASGSLQWYKNDTLISGATSATYTPQSTGMYTVSTTNSSGCASVSDPVYFAPVTVDDLELSSSISIQPNPAHTTVTLKGLKGAGVIEVYDIVGKLVYQQNAIKPPAETIDISNLSNGNYIIRVTYTNGERVTGKMVKQ